MRKMLAIAQKEINVMFNSPIPFIGLGVFALVIGFLFNSFVMQFVMIQRQQMMFQQGFGGINIQVLIEGTFKNTLFLFMILIPFLTMRLISEERAKDTTNLLFSAPITVTQILGGKVLGVMAVIGLFVLYTAFVPIFCFFTSTPDISTVLLSYVGFIFLSLAFASVGIFCSSLTKNQMLAGVLSFVIIFALFLFGVVTQGINHPIGDILGQISFMTHADNFFKGVFSSKDLVYFVTFTFFWLFLAHRILDSQSWR